MKLPNGYGSVYKLKGSRRNPWIARKTKERIIIDGKSKQTYTTIGYYKNRPDALQALADYNANPFDVAAAKSSFSEVYGAWSAAKYEAISHSNANGYRASYKLCSSLYDMKFSDIRASHLQKAIDTCGKAHPTLRKLKVLFSQMYDYAMKNDICQKDYSEYVDIGVGSQSDKRRPFSVDEISLLWKAVEGNEYIQVVLMLIYSGVRISELLDLKKEDVNIAERYFLVRKSKTDAGVRRVPIAKKTLPFFTRWMERDCEYLLCTPQDQRLKYYTYRECYWPPLMDELGIRHDAHDTRHTTISLLAAAHVDQTIIKKIVGHSGAMSLTEKVYTHFEIQPLLDAIDSI